MGGFSSFYAGLSGLQSYSSQLNVIGNNLANVSTTAFKSSRMTFQDLLYQTSFGSSRNPNQVGLGVQTGSVDTINSQGSLQSTGNITDLAIQGNGFFVVRDNQGGRQFTRAGNFSLDKDGNVATPVGSLLQGYINKDANGNIITSGALSNIKIPPGLIAPPQPTTKFDISAILNTKALVDVAGTTQNEAEVFSTTLTVYDSKGGAHDITVNLTPIDTGTDGTADQWDYDITVAGADVAGGTAGTPFSLGSGSLTFDAVGKLATPSANVAIATPAWANGASAQTIDWTLFDAAGNSLVRSYEGPSATSTVTQDGYSSGSLRTLTIDNNGAIDGIFTNGSTLHIARLALATFTNSGGLLKAGFNGYFEGSASGTATIGAANIGGRGAVSSAALELSNVDITQELTDMITAERGYQANSKIITTTDQLFQEALNLKR